MCFHGHRDLTGETETKLILRPSLRTWATFFRRGNYACDNLLSDCLTLGTKLVGFFFFLLSSVISPPAENLHLPAGVGILLSPMPGPEELVLGRAQARVPSVDSLL